MLWLSHNCLSLFKFSLAFSSNDWRDLSTLNLAMNISGLNFIWKLKTNRQMSRSRNPKKKGTMITQQRGPSFEVQSTQSFYSMPARMRKPTIPARNNIQAQRVHQKINQYS